MNRRLIFRICAALALTVSPLAARLKFEAQTIRVDAEPGAKYVDVVFPFTNTGDTAVEITDLKSSCGCTSVRVQSRTVAPGASDAVSARFDIGSRQGLQRKQITVVTREDRIPLQLEVDIPLLFEISNRLLVWARGAEPVPQSVDIKFHHDTPARIVSVTSYPPEGVNAEVAEIEAGKEFRIDVKPGSTGEAARSVLRIEYAYASGRTEVVTVFTRVQ